MEDAAPASVQNEYSICISRTNPTARIQRKVIEQCRTRNVPTVFKSPHKASPQRQCNHSSSSIAVMQPSG